MQGQRRRGSAPPVCVWGAGGAQVCWNLLGEFRAVPPHEGPGVSSWGTRTCPQAAFRLSCCGDIRPLPCWAPSVPFPCSVGSLHIAPLGGFEECYIPGPRCLHFSKPLPSRGQHLAWHPRPLDAQSELSGLAGDHSPGAQRSRCPQGRRGGLTQEGAALGTLLSLTGESQSP